MLITLALLGVATAITGLMGFVFFWPMTLVHLRDRYPAVHARIEGDGVVAVSSLRWLLAGRYRDERDPGLNGLGMPARIALVVLLAGIASAIGFGVAAWLLKP